MIAVLLVSSFLVLALSTTFGLVLARSTTHIAEPPRPSAGHPPGTLAVLIPASRDDTFLRRCLRSLATAATPDLVQVIVVHPDGSTPRIDGPASFEDRVELVTGPPTGKAAAVLLGLRRVNADWVVLLDSDTMLRPDGLSRLAGLCRGDAVAAYGLIRPCRGARRPLLDLTVDLDKALSHGVFRAGRAALGLWPNLPGQCYLIRSDILRRVYSERMGYLDDLVVTLRLAAMGERVAFLPEIVAEEEARETWLGYAVQRARWTLGVLQAGLDIGHLPGRRARPAIAWCLHAWLYYGWPLAIAAGAGALVAARLWWPALMLGACHASVWGYLTLKGLENLARWDSTRVARAPSVPTKIIAGGMVSIIPCLGLAAVVVMGLLACLGGRRFRRWWHIR